MPITSIGKNLAQTISPPANLFPLQYLRNDEKTRTKTSAARVLSKLTCPKMRPKHAGKPRKRATRYEAEQRQVMDNQREGTEKKHSGTVSHLKIMKKISISEKRGYVSKNRFSLCKRYFQIYMAVSDAKGSSENTFFTYERRSLLAYTFLFPPPPLNVHRARVGREGRKERTKKWAKKRAKKDKEIVMFSKMSEKWEGEQKDREEAQISIFSYKKVNGVILEY